MKAIAGKVMDRVRKSESGFTLIEMLIVVGIIVALAAAIVPQVVSFGGKGEEGQKSSEKSTVQLAMDAMLADKGKASVTAEATTSRNDWTTYPTGPTGTSPLSTGGYMSITSTTWFYCWDTKGKITAQQDASGAC